MYLLQEYQADKNPLVNVSALNKLFTLTINIFIKKLKLSTVILFYFNSIHFIYCLEVLFCHLLCPFILFYTNITLFNFLPMYLLFLEFVSALSLTVKCDTSWFPRYRCSLSNFVLLQTNLWWQSGLFILFNSSLFAI